MSDASIVTWTFGAVLMILGLMGVIISVNALLNRRK